MNATTAFERWASLPAKAYAPAPHFYGEEDFVTYFVNESRCWAQRVNALVTVYVDVTSGELVGCKVKGVRRLLSKIQAFHVSVSDGKLNLGLLFYGLVGEAKDEEEKELLDRVGKKFGSAELPSQALSSALGA